MTSKTTEKTGEVSMTAAELNKKINSIAKRGPEFIKDTEVASIACIEMAMKHENFDYATKLYRAMEKGKGLRHESLKQWFMEHGPFKWGKLKNSTMGFKKDKSENAIPFDLEHAKEHPYYEKGEVVEKPIDLEKIQKSIHQLVKKVDKKIESEAYEGSLEEIQEYLSVIKGVDRLADSKAA
jgi:hypothetical protein